MIIEKVVFSYPEDVVRQYADVPMKDITLQMLKTVEVGWAQVSPYSIVGMAYQVFIQDSVTKQLRVLKDKGTGIITP